jgi:hypothetical protein
LVLAYEFVKLAKHNQGSCESNQIRLAVAIYIGGNHLVPAFRPVAIMCSRNSRPNAGIAISMKKSSTGGEYHHASASAEEAQTLRLA